MFHMLPLPVNFPSLATMLNFNALEDDDPLPTAKKMCVPHIQWSLHDHTEFKDDGRKGGWEVSHCVTNALCMRQTPPNQRDGSLGDHSCREESRPHGSVDTHSYLPEFEIVVCSARNEALVQHIYLAGPRSFSCRVGCVAELRPGGGHLCAPSQGSRFDSFEFLAAARLICA